MSEIPLLFWLVAAVAMVAVVLWVGSGFAQISKRGGVAGMMVGADIEDTLLDMAGDRGGRCRVHAFRQEGPGDPRVGLEVRQATPVSFDTLTAGLSPGQARNLAAILRQAAGEPGYRVSGRSVRDGPI